MHMGQLWVSFCPARRLQVNMNGYSADPSAPSLHFRLVSVSISKTSRWQTSCEADWCKVHHSPFHIWFISWRPRRVCSWTGRKPEYLACVQIRYSQPRDLGTRIRHPPGIQPGNGKIRYIFISMCRWLSHSTSAMPSFNARGDTSAALWGRHYGLQSMRGGSWLDSSDNPQHCSSSNLAEKESDVIICYIHFVPVVPDKAVAEVSKIGSL